MDTYNMKYLDTSSLRDLTNFIYTPQMPLDRINNANIIDLSSFDTSKITNCIGLIHGIFENVIISLKQTIIYL